MADIEIADLTEEQLQTMYEWAEIDRLLGMSLRSLIISSLRLGHTTIQSTARTYVHVDRDVSPLGWIAREAVLGHAVAIREAFPELVKAWDRAYAEQGARRS